MNIQQQTDTVRKAILDLFKPNFSLGEILDALEILQEEIDMRIQGIEHDIKRERQLKIR